MCIFALTICIYCKARNKTKKDIEYKRVEKAKKNFNQDLEIIAQNGINAKYGSSIEKGKNERPSNQIPVEPNASPLPVINDDDDENDESDGLNSKF